MHMSETELKSTRVRMLTFAIILYIFYGIKLSWSLFGSQLIAENGWTLFQATFPYSVQTVVSSFAAIIGGRLADKIETKWVVLMGGLFTGVGLIMCGLSHNWWIVLIGCGVFIALGSFVSAALTTCVIGWWPANKKGFAGGLLTCSNSFNTILLTPIINMLLMAVGMRRTCAITGGAICIVFAIFSMFIKKAPKELIELNAEQVEEMAKDKNQRKLFLSPYNNAPIRDILKSKEFAMWFLLYFFACLSGQVATSQITTIAKTLVVWPETLAWLTVSLAGLGSFLGRFFMSYIGDKLGAFRTYTIDFILQAVLCILFPHFTGLVGMSIGIFGIGWCFGGSIALANVGNTDLWGKGNLGTMYGVTAVAYSLAGLVGPTLFARIYDATGSYGILFYCLAAAAIIGIFFSEYLNRFADPDKQVLN